MNKKFYKIDSNLNIDFQNIENNFFIEDFIGQLNKEYLLETLQSYFYKNEKKLYRSHRYEYRQTF